MKRPLVLIACLYVAGILIARFVFRAPFPLLAGAGGLALIALVWSRARTILLYPLILLAGAANLGLHTAILSPHDLRRLLGDQPEIVAVRGTLRETPSLRVYEHDEKESWRTRAQIEVIALRPNGQHWQPASGQIVVTTPGMLTNFFAGQSVEITGVVRRPKIAAAEGTFDYRAYLRQLEIYYQLQAVSEQDWRVISSPTAPPLADRFRVWARKALTLGLPAEDESLRLEWALTLGWKPALTEDVSEPFVRAATYHIFAVDGLRMAIIFGIFFNVLRVLGLARGVCGLLLLPLLWFYVALTGWPASAIRATVMLTIIILGWALKRPSDLINSLFAAALIILVWQPQQLFQAGFQLSFFVVLCIILTVPALHKIGARLVAPDPLLPPQLRPAWQQKLRAPAKHLGDLLLTSLAAWLGSLPLVAYYFHIVTPVSTPANMVAVPLCAFVLVSNLASLLLAGWFPAGAELFNHAGWFLMECIRVTSHWFANWPKAYFYVPPPSLLTSGLYYLLLLSLVTGWLFKSNLRIWKIAGLSLLVVCWSGLCWQQAHRTRLSILSPNGGMAIYSHTPGAGSDLLIDCGTSNSVQFLTKPFLRGQGVNHLPNLLLSHGDLHHIGGAQLVDALFSVEHVCISPIRFRSPAYRKVIKEFGNPPEKLRTISRGDRLGSWTVLHPEASDHFSQADDSALVLAGAFSGTRVLLLSDLGRPGQNALLERIPDLRAEIVVTGLPVRNEALGDALLDAIQPRVIVVADSEFPVSERATAKLCSRLAQRKIPVIYTRSAGAATIEFQKHGWVLRTMSGIKIEGQKQTMKTIQVSHSQARD